jgi:zinc and cadmium transporter
MPPLIQALIATFLVSLISLVGVFVVRWSERVEERLLGFAAGVLLATAFLDLFPEAVERSAGDGNVFRGRARRDDPLLRDRAPACTRSTSTRRGHAHTSGYLILIGDGLHNMIDGIVIAASFLVSPELGITTTVAVSAHEIPQEIADYGILVRRFSRARALLLNFVSGLTALAGAVLCWGFREVIEPHLGWALTGTAGMFIYIAASDLIPELHHVRRRGSWAHTLPLLAGIAVIALLVAVLPR